jgi:sec-independent protein translocase protein TatA
MVLELIEKPSVLIVLLLVIVVFGAKRLPDSARALGKSMRILKAEAKGLKDDDAPKAAPTAPVVQAPALPVAPVVADVPVVPVVPVVPTSTEPAPQSQQP